MMRTPFSGEIESPIVNFQCLHAMRGAAGDEKLISRLERGGIQEKCEAGEARLEQAFALPDSFDDKRLELLSSAEANWQNCIMNYDTIRAGHESSAGKSLTHLAYLQTYQWLLLNKTLPPEYIAKKTYKDLIGVGEWHSYKHREMSSELKSLEESEYNTQKVNGIKSERSRLAGNMTEISLKLLLKRFGIYELKDRSWCAIPSLLTENHGQGSTASVNRRWGISVLTDPDELGEPELTYKVQSKTSDTWEQKSPPDDNIALVCLNPDLRLEGESKLPASTIIHECKFEVNEPDNPNYLSVKQRLEKRSQLLLETIDR